jgi:hypothetical protein
LTFKNKIKNIPELCVVVTTSNKQQLTVNQFFNKNKRQHANNKKQTNKNR